MGWVVDNPDIADPADATMRSYMQKQRRKHNDEKERAQRDNYSWLTRPCWAQQRHSQRPDEHKRLLTIRAGHGVNVDLPE